MSDGHYDDIGFNNNNYNNRVISDPERTVYFILFYFMMTTSGALYIYVTPGCMLIDTVQY